MLTREEHLLIGLKALERLRPSLRLRREQLPQPQSPSAPLGSDIDPVEETAFADGFSDLPLAEAPNEVPIPWSSSLDVILERYGPFPAGASILGVCEDGLPLVLDLANPAPGAILVAGDAGSGKTNLLSALITSACRINPPNKLSFSVISVYPDEYQPVAGYAHLQELHAVEEPSASQLITRLAEMAETRRRGGSLDPVLILGIDDLAAFLDLIDGQDFTNLHYLIKHGPRARIWPVATLPTAQIQRIDPRMLTAFRTLIMGSITSRDLASYLLNNDGAKIPESVLSGQFCVPNGEGWRYFWACETGFNAMPDTGDVG